MRHLVRGVAIVILVLWTGIAYAATTPCNGTLSDCQAKINAAASGDTISIPAGSFSWSGGLSISKNVKVEGAGSASTIVAWTGSTFLGINNGASNAVIGNFRVNIASTSNLIEVGMDPVNWRIHHMIFSSSGTQPGYWFYRGGMNNTTETHGLVDHTTFTGIVGEKFWFQGPCNAWTLTDPRGSKAAMFFEDNTFTAGSSYAYLDAHANSISVWRKNTFTNVYPDVHGLYSNQALACSTPYIRRSGRSIEFYNNTITSNTNYPIVYPRGGTGVVYGNRGTYSATGSALIFLDDYCVRINEAVGGNNSCVAQCPSAGSSPLKDTIGRGKDIAYDPVNGTGQQTSEPFLMWDNLWANGTYMWAVPKDDSGYGNACGTDLSDFIVENRDYCVGTGTNRTGKPTTCNSVTTTYSAYTYPHPLIGGTSPPIGTPVLSVRSILWFFFVLGGALACLKAVQYAWLHRPVRAGRPQSGDVDDGGLFAVSRPTPGPPAPEGADVDSGATGHWEDANRSGDLVGAGTAAPPVGRDARRHE